jgi:invasion protein IalB
MGFSDLVRPFSRVCLLAGLLASAVLPAHAQTAAPAPAAPPAATGSEPAEPAARAAPQPEPAQPGTQSPGQMGTVKSTHDAWSVVCDKPAGASTEQCVLMQNVLSEDRPELGLSVVVLKTADRKAKILRVLAPLGVLLLPPKGGLGLNVDGKDLGHAYFARCFADGCYAEVTLEDDLLKTLRSGQVATFIVHESLEQDGIGIPVDLKGFAAGYDALP